MKRLMFVALLALLGAALLVASGPTAPVVAQSGNTWTASYFNNPDWAYSPVLIQTVPFVSFNWGYGSPGPNVPVDNFTARFDTSAFFYAGSYRFTTTADDEVVLVVDGVTYIDTRNAGQSGKTQTVVVPMTQGNHQLQVWYREYTGLAYISVNWQYIKPNGGGGGTPPPPPPPPSSCSPQSATSVQTKYGDYTPCIQQNIHQKNCFQSDGAWDSPNMGSIEMEPQITVWGTCTADQTTQFRVSCDPDIPLQNFKCSKTEAGWFPS